MRAANGRAISTSTRSRSPSAVRIVLERRMQRISSETRRCAEGRRGDRPRISIRTCSKQVADVDGDALIAALDEAEQARMLSGPSGRRDIAWRFPHQLTCQALTGAIPAARRQRLHLRVADAMARLDATSRVYTSGIAHHLYCAGRLADPARTAGALIAAGDAAHAVYATDEAVGTIAVRSRCCEDTSGQRRRRGSRVQERLADLLALHRRSRGRDGALRRRLRRAIERDATPSIEARIAPQDRHASLAGRRSAAAMASYRRALDALSGSAAHIEAAHLYQELGLAAFRSGDNSKAIEWAERALQSAERALTADDRRTRPRSAGRRQPRSHTRPTRSASRWRDRVSSTPPASASSGVLPRRAISGLLDVACRAYANLGVLYSSVEPKRAIEVSLTGLEMATRIGAASLQSYIYANLAAAYCALTDRL